MGQAINAVAHDKAHGARIPIGPNGFAAVLLLDGIEARRHFSHGLIPRDAGELPLALFADALQGIKQPIGVVDAFGVACHFFANDTTGVGIVFGPPHPADGVFIEEFHIQCTGRRAIMWADGFADLDVSGWAVDVHVGDDRTFPRKL
jgi:hypothetical protein